MTCTRIGNAIVCTSPGGRLHVGNRYVWMNYRRYCGPSFYTMEKGEEVHYEPVDENDPVWEQFGKWLDKFDRIKSIQGLSNVSKKVS